MLRNVLEKNGVYCWMAPDSIPAGGDYASAIPKAIKECDIFLLVLSKAAQGSKWVPKELDVAITFGRTIIPFQIDPEALTEEFNFRLTNVQRIDAFHNQELAYQQLLNQIRQQPGTVNADQVICALPEVYTHFQLLKVDNASQVDIKGIRSAADAAHSLSVPIGINSDGQIVKLDLHYQGDGPNGLIIGPAKSGKSEFLLTLCLALGISFAPEDIRFHMVDLKGGRVVSELSGLPHMGACLSSANPNAIKEFSAMLQAEIQTRYNLLEQYAVSNHAQYLEKRKQAPMSKKMPAMPHLLILIDEFRELKVDWPEVAHQLQEWGSGMNAVLLGVHLIYSTQNYEGLIDYSIFHMVGFKICSCSKEGELMEYLNDNKTGTSERPGRLYFQSLTQPQIQLMQLAYSGEALRIPGRDEAPPREFWHFFERESQRRAIINALSHYEESV